jgi:hypothetical protein
MIAAKLFRQTLKLIIFIGVVEFFLSTEKTIF